MPRFADTLLEAGFGSTVLTLGSVWPGSDETGRCRCDAAATSACRGGAGVAGGGGAGDACRPSAYTDNRPLEPRACPPAATVLDLTRMTWPMVNNRPTSQPTKLPTDRPTNQPTDRPTDRPGVAHAAAQAARDPGLASRMCVWLHSTSHPTQPPDGRIWTHRRTTHGSP